jgi:tetratricopeptide (TPR) repeat protein
VVRGLVEALYRYAREHDREHRLAIRSGVEEYWRPRYAVVEHAADRRPSRPDTAVPRQLPPVAPHFVGRSAELDAVTRAAGPVLVTGMAGVGKTTLAVAWAHRSARLFPDGQLYVNLRGFDPSGTAVTPEQAVRGFLDALAVPAVPAGFAAQVGLYRSLLAGRRMLVLLDNASDGEQVRALLPGAPGCRVLVTSRVELTGLVAADGAYPLMLDVLPERDARQLLAHRLGRARVAAEPAAVDRLVAACGRLPMALAIVAARGATRPDFALTAIAEEADGRLGAFQVGDESVDMRGVFSWSYRALSAPAARLFRLLGLHPGPDAAGPALASLAGFPVGAAGPLLAELVRANLVTEPEPGRYGLHDLLRAYAMELVEAEPERDAARRRALDHYAHTGYAAALLVSPARSPVALPPVEPGVTPEPLADRDAALRWFTAERAVILAAAGREEPHAWLLGWDVADFLELRGHLPDWVTVQGHAVAAARRLGDREILARSLLILGNAYWRAGRHEDAVPPYREAHDLFADLGDVVWQARAVNGLGGLLEQQGRFVEALPYARRGLALYRAAGDAEGLARSYNSLGWLHCRLGEYGQAVEHCRRALARYREMGSGPGQAATWDSLGYAEHGRRRYARAVFCYRQALALLRAHGDRYHEGETLGRLGDTHEAAGSRAAARDAWRQALAVLDECDHPGAAEVRARLRGSGRDRQPAAPTEVS